MESYTHTDDPASPEQSALAHAFPRAIGPVFDVAPGVLGLRTWIVNLYFVGTAGGGGWMLVDAGMPLSAHKIIAAAEAHFGHGTQPMGIVLTHGHFDHVGSLQTLLKHWNVPVYAHEMELPYLTGKSSYPPPDPTVGGGLMARSAPLFPSKPINLGAQVTLLPADGTIPDLPGWRWIETPGHSPGHVSLFRESDRTLIAGDAFVTTKQESLSSVLTQRQEMHGPPMYFTPDWQSAAASVRRLAALSPRVAATGHGLPMENPRLDHALNELARHFEEVAVPRHGRYVPNAAVTNVDGVVSVPPPAPDPLPKLLLATAAVVGAAALVSALAQPKRRE